MGGGGLTLSSFVGAECRVVDRIGRRTEGVCEEAAGTGECRVGRGDDAAAASEAAEFCTTIARVMAVKANPEMVDLGIETVIHLKSVRSEVFCGELRGVVDGDGQTTSKSANTFESNSSGRT